MWKGMTGWFCFTLLGLLLALAAECWQGRRGPLSVLESWLHHVRAAWFWSTRELLPICWGCRRRYREWLDVVRYGRI